MSEHLDGHGRAVIVRAQGCTKIYGHGATSVTAVADVDLTIRAGELLALVGPSGSGKSTLLSLLGALLAPTRGHVRIEGVDVSSLDERERTDLRARRIGFVFQAAGLVPFLTAEENIAIAGTFAGMRRHEARQRASRLLGELGMTERAAHLPEALSGGERQRVAIARALLVDPPVLLADEPTAHLDADRGQQVVELLVDAVHGGGRAGLIVTHDPLVAAQADRIIRVADGRLIPAA